MVYSQIILSFDLSDWYAEEEEYNNVRVFFHLNQVSDYQEELGFFAWYGRWRGSNRLWRRLRKFWSFMLKKRKFAQSRDETEDLDTKPHEPEYFNN